ncbi:Alcohol dehydrogenase, class IV [Lachnospiraceae bacterium C10]|nr:Alcohol dehydrogenase, class IV [Lachnospiraceae bacterium C10]SDW20077.1 Alcohol dehydrogenase, class IV [Lachnospiraceae bacterium KHCPX20]
MDVPLELSSRLYQSVAGYIIRHSKGRETEKVEGVDSLFSIPDILDRNHLERPLIVTGPHIAESEFFQSFLNDRETSYTVFSSVKSDPAASQIAQIARMYEEENCDSIIAIGGGSNLDAAKAAGAMIARPGHALRKMRGLFKVRREIPFFIAVPTTAGTGSEMTMAAVVTDDATGQKYSLIDPVLKPDVAVLDPSLLVSLPQKPTAYAGVDALVHAVEAYLNERYHREDTKDYCEEAVEAIMEFLPKSYDDGEDLEAREEMLIASNKAAEAFNVAGVGNIHALAHAIGGRYSLPHGYVNAILLPIVLRDYGKAVEAQIARLASICDIEKDGSRSERAEGFIRVIEEMNARMGIPDHIEEIKEQDIAAMSAWAAKEANPLYAVPVIYDKRHFAEVLRKASGR